MASKIDIFAVLSYLDSGNTGVWEALSEDPDMLKDLRKNVNWMLPQWMSAAKSDADHAELLRNFNENCNVGWFGLYEHPELQTKLLATCGLQKRIVHKFVKPIKARNLSKMGDLLGHKYVDVRDEQVEIWCRINTKANMKRLAESLGYQPTEIKELEKAFDALRKI